MVMPRGLLPAGNVAITSQLWLSSTVTLLPRSLLTKTLLAEAAPANNKTAGKSTSADLSILSSKSVAGSFGRIDAKRVEWRMLVQVAILGRNGNRHPTVGQKDRLAQLPVPGAEGQLLALERGQFEVCRKGICSHGCRISLARPRHRLADHAHGKPGLVVFLAHVAAGQFLEAALELGRT